MQIVFHSQEMIILSCATGPKVSRQQGHIKASVSWKESAKGLYVMKWVSWSEAVHTVFIVLLVCLFSVFWTLMSQSRAGRNPAVCAVAVWFSISTVSLHVGINIHPSVPRVGKGAVHTSRVDLHSGHFRKLSLIYNVMRSSTLSTC